MVRGGVPIRRPTDDRTRHGGDNGQGKDAGRVVRDGPRCLLAHGPPFDVAQGRRAKSTRERQPKGSEPGEGSLPIEPRSFGLRGEFPSPPEQARAKGSAEVSVSRRTPLRLFWTRGRRRIRRLGDTSALPSPAP